MARQASTPVRFNPQIRPDSGVLMSSGRAGKVVPVGYVPLLPGDSMNGQFGIDLDLAEMPRPLLNGVSVNVQAWFVPKIAHPRFTGADELIHAFRQEDINSIDAAGAPITRTPPTYFEVLIGADLATARASDLFKTLGIHAMQPVNSDLIDAYNLAYNFRLASYSSKLTRRQYYAESPANSTTLARAFWPQNRYTGVVPDYERALVVGNLDLDVVAGTLPVKNLFAQAATLSNPYIGNEDGLNKTLTQAFTLFTDAGALAGTPGAPYVFTDLAGQTIPTTLADIEKAKVTQSFAKLRAAYAGNDATGFDNDAAIVAMLMQGLEVPADQFNRPWLLDSKRVPVGFAERFATDGASLDQSVSVGRASARLALNVPKNSWGGYVIVTCEVVPERIYERQADEALHLQSPDNMPNALRDVQRVEPVDEVLNRRLDARHTSDGAIYGYEPMNMKWHRSFTRLGGAFYQDTPGTPVVDQRMGIWQPDIVDPVYTDDHFLVPDPFPHHVFSDTLGPAFEFVSRWDCRIAGLTQVGDPLAEDNSEYTLTAAEGT